MYFLELTLSLELIALSMGFMLLVWARYNRGSGIGVANFSGIVVVILSILLIGCTLYKSYKGAVCGSKSQCMKSEAMAFPPAPMDQNENDSSSDTQQPPFLAPLPGREESEENEAPGFDELMEKLSPDHESESESESDSTDQNSEELNAPSSDQEDQPPSNPGYEDNEEDDMDNENPMSDLETKAPSVEEKTTVKNSNKDLAQVVAIHKSPEDSDI
jgi:hypothetical protein